MIRTALLVVTLLSMRAAGAEDRPNILFIFTDDQSHRTVSCYPEAYPWVKTPNIDALAAEGVRFTHTYMGTWCMPSRATMLTGRHQYGVESMRMQGDSTAQIGKWHTGVDSGFGRDWDHQIVWSRPKYPKNAGHYYDDQIVEVDGKVERISGYTTDWYTDKAENYIRGENRSPDKRGNLGRESRNTFANATDGFEVSRVRLNSIQESSRGR